MMAQSTIPTPLSRADEGHAGEWAAGALGSAQPFDLDARAVERVRPRCQLVTTLSELESMVEPWSRLALELAVTPNVQYAPAAAIAAARHYGMQGTWLFIWFGKTLIGVFPAQRMQIAGVDLPVTSLLRHVHSFLCTPLVHRNYVDSALDAYLAHLTSKGTRKQVLVHPLVLADDTVAAGLQRVLERWGMMSSGFAAHRRACLKSALTGEAYLAQSLGKKRIKEYRRLAKRLGELGDVAFELVGAGDSLLPAFDAFLALEASGWKADRGTAISQSTACSGFFQEIVNEGGKAGNVQIAKLTLGGRMIAATLIVANGRQGYLWKIAYDQTLARFSPGVLLVLELTRHILDLRLFDMVDSCAIADHPMIDRIWRERIAVEDRLIIAGLRPWMASILFILEGWRRKLRILAKILLAQYRNWRQK